MQSLQLAPAGGLVHADELSPGDDGLGPRSKSKEFSFALGKKDHHFGVTLFFFDHDDANILALFPGGQRAN